MDVTIQLQADSEAVLALQTRHRSEPEHIGNQATYALEAFFALLTNTVQELRHRFSFEELQFIALVEATMDRHPWSTISHCARARCEEYLEDAAALPLQGDWPALAKKLSALSTVEEMALADALDRYNLMRERRQDLEEQECLQLIGLLD